MSLGAETLADGAPVTNEMTWPTEMLLFTQRPVDEALRLQDETLQKMLAGEISHHQIIALEHPPTLLIGEDVSEETLAGIRDAIPNPNDFHWLRTSSTRDVEYLGPGQLAIYITFNLGSERQL